ncbi:MAG: FAD-binding protein [Oscillospiraceae bacterium]|nr:FAD-binding protein [Oscillospiraceae bacterium]
MCQSIHAEGDGSGLCVRHGVEGLCRTQQQTAQRTGIDAQPRKISYSIGSRDLIQMIAERFINDPAFAARRNFFLTWEEESHLEIPVKKADTLEELAQLCGMPAGALSETIRAYNQFCAEGVDRDFGKEKRYLIPIDMEKGPYYAIYGQRFSEASMGGLMVDGQCRVLRNDNTPIPGLYGVGDATSAMHRRGKLAVISELTWATASSYTSGSNAVAYLDSKAQ